MWTRMGSDPIQSQEWVISLFLFLSSSRLVYKYLEGILHVALASLIEGHWCIDILLLFVIVFNPYNVYSLLYGAPTYGDISISPYLGY